MYARLVRGVDETNRRRIDNLLGVRGWAQPGREATFTKIVDETPPGAPAWWLGDEEASQSFISEMGVG